MEVERYRTQLLQKRGELLGGPAAKPLQWTMENNSGRQGDMADQASGNNEVHIQLKLKQTDAKILQAIEEALRRIDEGTYGVCRDCGEPIADARLNAIPWVLCVTDRADGRPFAQSDLSTLRTLAAPLALALGRERALAQAGSYAEAAAIDPVSGLYNRRYFHT